MADGSVSTGVVTGTGTTNYIPKWTSASAIGNSLIFDNGTNVGINTASPATILHVTGGTLMTGGWNKTATLQAQYPTLIFNSNASKWGAIGYDHSNAMSFWVNGTSDNVNGTGLNAFQIYNTGSADFNYSLTVANALNVGKVGDVIYTKSNGTSYSRFLYSGAHLNVVFSGGTDANNGGFGINNYEDTVRLFNMNNAGTAFFAGNVLVNGATTLTGIQGGVAVNGTTSSGVVYRLSNTNRGYTYMSQNGNMNVETTSGSISLAPNGSPAVTIATTGVATFSNTIIAKQSQISKSVTDSDWLSTWDNTATNGHKMYFGYGNAAGTRFGLYITGGDGTNIDLTVANKFYVMGTGNVLINTTTDAGYKLDVNGTGRFSGAVTVNTGTTNQNVKIFGDKVGISRTSDAAEVVYFSKTNTLGSDGTANIHGYDGIVFRTQGAETVKLTIASTGAATFSSSVTASRFETTSASNGAFGINQNGDDGVSYRFYQYSTSGTTYVINTQMGASGEYDIWQYSGAWRRNLRIAATGAATFASSIAAVGSVSVTASSSSISPSLVLSQTGGNTYSAVGINRADGTGISTGLGSSLVFRSGDASDFPIQFATANNIRMTISTSGFLGIGTQSPLAPIHASGGTAMTGGWVRTAMLSAVYPVLAFNSNNSKWAGIGYDFSGSQAFIIWVNAGSENVSTGTGALVIAGSGAATFVSSVTATSFFESSDLRKKKLIESNPIIAGIENLQAKLYEKNGKLELGYFAQDAEKIMPYAVTKNADGFLNLSYREVHTAKIARLEQRVAELEKQLNAA